MMEPYRLLVTGSRTWVDWQILAALQATRDLANRLERKLIVVHGGCPTGADAFADLWARTTTTTREVHPAKWKVEGIYNKYAGVARNQRMVDLGADRCLAFIKGGSRGATHCARAAEEAGIETVRFTA